MTEKKTNILNAASALFAEEGYKGTSTNKVAKRAKVSEGLIFRHFGNKEGLLQAVLKQGEERMKALFIPIVMELDPKEVIRKTITLPFTLPESEHKFWRLQYQVKWEMNYNSSAKLEPLKMALRNAFEKLGYTQPRLEAEALSLYLDGIAHNILLNEMENKEALCNFLLQKYGL